MSKDISSGLDVANTIITVVFALEMVLKLVGLGSVGYVADPFNPFDGLVTIVAIAELAIAGPGGSDNGRALSVLRLLRIVRVFRLVRHWDSMQQVLQILVRSLPQFGYLALLLLLFLFVYSIMAMHLLAGAFDDDISRSRGLAVPIAEERRRQSPLGARLPPEYSTEELEAAMTSASSTKGVHGMVLFDIPRNNFEGMGASFVTMF